MFGNAKVNLSKKQYTDIFQPPKQTNQLEDSENRTPIKDENEVVVTKQTFTKSEIYKIED